MQPFDLVIRGGTVATATDSFKADVGEFARAAPLVAVMNHRNLVLAG